MSKTRFAVLAVALALAARLDAADTYQFDKAHTNGRLPDPPHLHDA